MSKAEGDERRETFAKDLESIVEARRELDPVYEPALVEAFLERVAAAWAGIVGVSLAGAWGGRRKRRR